MITVTNQDNQKFQQRIMTTTFSHLTSINGIVVIATKAFANAELAGKLKNIKGDFSIVLLQNGLNIEKPVHRGCAPKQAVCGWTGYAIRGFVNREIMSEEDLKDYKLDKITTEIEDEINALPHRCGFANGYKSRATAHLKQYNKELRKIFVKYFTG